MNDNLDLIFQQDDKLLFSFDAKWTYRIKLSSNDFVIGKCFVTKKYLILEYDILQSVSSTGRDRYITSPLFRIPTFLILPRNIITNIEFRKDELYIEGKRFYDGFSDSKKLSHRIAKKLVNPENIKLEINIKEENKNKRKEILKELYDILNE